MAIGIPALNNVVGGNQSLRIEWSTVANASEYRIKFGTAPGDHSATKTVLVSELSTPAEPFFTMDADVGVVIENNTTYWVVVTAYGIDPDSGLSAESDASNELNSIASIGSSVLAQPRNFRVKSGAGSAELHWNAPDVQPDEYLIEYTDNLDVPIVWQTQSVLSPATTTTITGLTNDTPYYFKISAKQGESVSVATEPEIAVAVPQATITTPLEGHYFKVSFASPGLYAMGMPLSPTNCGADTQSVKTFVGANQLLWQMPGNPAFVSSVEGTTRSLEAMDGFLVIASAQTKHLIGDAW